MTTKLGGRARKHPGCRLLAALVMTALVVGFGPTPADAHTDLIQSSPPIGQPSGGTIDFIDLAFSEPVSDATITVFSNGEVLGGETTVAQGQIIRFELDEPLRTPGQYDVSYELVSFDGDQTTVLFSFSYEQEAIQPLRLGGAGLPESSGRNWTQIIASVVLGAGLIGLLAITVSRIDAKRRGSETGDEPGAR